MIHIVGVNQDTVVGVRRTAAGFEYRVARKGDGTVPVALARLPNLRCYFVEGTALQSRQQYRRDSRHPRSTEAGPHGAPARHWHAQRGPERRIDDAQLRLEGGDKIDWGA